MTAIIFIAGILVGFILGCTFICASCARNKSGDCPAMEGRA